MFRWVALARIMAQEQVFQRANFAPRYLLNDWPLRRAEIPATLPGVAHVDSRGRAIFSTCGGVTISFPDGIARAAAPGRWPGEAASRALSARPGTGPAAWLFS